MDTLIAQMNMDWAVMGDTVIDPATKGRVFRADSSRMYRGTGYGMALAGGSLSLRLDKAGVAGVISSRPTLDGFTNPFATADAAGGRGGGRGGRGAPGPGSMRGGGPAGGAANGGGFGRGGPSGGWGVIRIFDTYNKNAPGVALSCEDYGLVARLAENNQHPKVRLDLESQQLGEQPAFNTIATIRGSEKPNEYVILSAHFDSWDGGSGATDNGTGTMMVLEAMRLLKLAYPHPKRTIIAAHFASEEQGLNGSRAFAEDHPEILKGLQALFNQDNGTGRVQSLSATGVTDIGPHLRSWYNALSPYFTDSLSSNVVSWSFSDNAVTGAPGGTDGSVFSCYATPSIGMGAVSWNYSAYTWHTNRDTYDKIVFDDLKHNATLAAELAYEASEDPGFIKRDRSPGDWPADWPANCGKVPRTTKPRLY
jgi:hypothetical protein